jgi:hypothetical protein
MRRQRQQHALLLGEHGGDRLVAPIGMPALMRDGVAPGAELRVQIVEVLERARGEEGVPEVWIWRSTFPFSFARAGAQGRGAK